MSEKEFKRDGFLLAECRYNEVLPLLNRLNELDIQQNNEENNNNNNNNRESKSSNSRRR